MPLLSYKCNYSNFTKPNGLFHSGPLSPETSSQCWLQERATSQGIWRCFNVTGSCQWYCGLHMKEPQFETQTQLHGVRSSWARLNGSVTLNQTYVTALCGVKELWLVETQWTPTSSFTADGPRGSAVVYTVMSHSKMIHIVWFCWENDHIHTLFSILLFCDISTAPTFLFLIF